jgi:predicted kinase
VRIIMKLIVFSGLPGTGKSTLAEAVGRRLSIPVFARDWLEATLRRNELTILDQNKSLGYAAYDLMTTLAERQLMLDQSAILDSVAATRSIRDAWKELSVRYQAKWQVIECVSSEEALHRSRLAKRERKIPGWYELEWSDIQKVQAYYLPWDEGRLVLDMVNPLELNLAKALAYCE